MEDPDPEALFEHHQASPVSPNYVAQMPGEKSQGNDDQTAT